MRLSEFLRPDFVVTSLQARDVDGIVHEVSARAAAAGVGAEDVIASKLLEREMSHSTVMGSGLAVPHATIPGLEEPVIGVAVASDPVDFGPAEMGPVKVFVVLLSPPGRERDHVKLLARICRLGRRRDFLDLLDEARDGEEIVRVLETVDAQHA